MPIEIEITWKYLLQQHTVSLWRTSNDFKYVLILYSIIYDKVRAMLNTKQEDIVFDPTETLDGVTFPMVFFQLRYFVSTLNMHSNKLHTLLRS